jgi:hypothetical protein
MRCVCCDVSLSDGESVLKHPETGQYLDMCCECLIATQIVPKKLINQLMVSRFNETNESEHSDFKDTL